MDKYIFLREYTKEDKTNHGNLIERSINELPFTLAYPISQLYKQLDKDNYGKAMNYALDFFEISVQYTSIILFVTLQKNKNDLDKATLLRITNKIDTKRPLSFGDWMSDIFTILINLASSRQLDDNGLSQSLKSHLIPKRANILLGHKGEPSIVRIRNEYKGHSTTLSENIYRDVIYTMEPLLLKMLNALQPLHNSKAYSCNIQNDTVIHKGISSKKVDTTIENLLHNHYYIKLHPTGEMLDLHPFIFCSNDNFIYVFQSLKEESISYISSDENAITLINDRWNDDFDIRFQQIDPSFDISKDLNWNEIKSSMKSESLRFLTKVNKEKKYNKELFVERKQLSDIQLEFHSSDKSIFPLLGEAGQGKTNQLCYWTERHIERNECVLLLSGSDFSMITLEEKLRKILGVKSRNIRKSIDTLNSKAIENDKCIYIYLDAINECLLYSGHSRTTLGPIDLYNAITEIFLKEGYSCFKILFTCRNYTWKTILQKRTLENKLDMFSPSDNEIEVRGFTYPELETAYDIYRQLYQMETTYNKLGSGVKIRLKDPLMLKVACTNYLGCEVPNNITSYTSISLFEDMMEKIRKSYAGQKQCDIIKTIAKYFLLQYESGIQNDRISINLLSDAYNDSSSSLHYLSHLVFNKDSITIAYTELLNKPERPILRLTESVAGESNDQVQFIYERFLEYIMALVFVEREVDTLCDTNKNIPAEKLIETIHIANSSVVFMGAVRNAIIMDIKRTGSISTIISLVRDHGDNYEVALLTNEVFNVLIRENYEDILFNIIDVLIKEQLPNSDQYIEEFNIINKKITNNEADSDIISRHKYLNRILMPIVRMRRQALVTTVNGVFLTDFFNENLYITSPLIFFKRLIVDPIAEVSNDACMYAYYLSNKKHTNEFTPLSHNLAEQIVNELYRTIKSKGLLKTVCITSLRTERLIYVETAFRITTLLIIDELMSETEEGVQSASRHMNEIKDLFKWGTLDFKLLRLAMPFLQSVLRKQITFQAVYVNNVIEYQTYWQQNVIPIKVENGNEWSRESIGELMPYVYHYLKCKNQKEEYFCPNFIELHDKILSAYSISDGFSFLILERILSIMGISSWDNVSPLMSRFFSDDLRENEWFCYSQMSMLYVLSQIQINTEVYNDDITKIYEKESEDWTLRNRGLFKARNSYKANSSGLYKRNVLSWYGVVYCKHTGDGVAHIGDEICVPLFYRLIDRAIENRDRELLIHLIDNISELISDFGYIKTSLDLLYYTMSKLDNKELIDEIDNVIVNRDGIYDYKLTKLIANVLGTAKHYFPLEINSFIRRDIVDLSFSGVSQYREELLDYNPSGESLPDLLTHKFGKFLIWALLNMEAVDSFAHEAVNSSISSKNSFEWSDRTVRILFKHMFDLKL